MGMQAAPSSNLSSCCRGRLLPESPAAVPVSKVSWLRSESKGRIVLRSPRALKQHAVKAIATPDPTVQLPLTAADFEYVNKRIENPWTEKNPCVTALEPTSEVNKDLELNEENIEKVVNQVKANLVGTGDGDIRLTSVEENLIKVQLTGLVRTSIVERALTVKLRDSFPSIRAVQFFP